MKLDLRIFVSYINRSSICRIVDYKKGFYAGKQKPIHHFASWHFKLYVFLSFVDECVRIRVEEPLVFYCLYIKELSRVPRLILKEDPYEVALEVLPSSAC